VALPERAIVLPLPLRRRAAHASIVALRPRQWTKNLLLFAGLVFAAQLGDPSRWLQAGVAFFSFCAASSAAYVVNDLRDAAADRLHPAKRSRPIARGELSRASALWLAGGLGALGVALAAALGLVPLLFLLAFGALQGAYTFRLKQLVLVDVMTIGALFVLRAAAGAAVVDVRISPWLLLCTALLALFLALAKRRGELVLVGAEATPGRPALAGYSLALVDQLVAVVAASMVVAYSIYTFSAHSQAMMATIPFVLFGVFRYLLLVHAHELGEEPEAVLLTDGPILLTVTLWATSAGTILMLTGAA